MSNPIKPYTRSVTLSQHDSDGYQQKLEITVETGGAGHFARLETNCWEIDVDELDGLVQTIRQLVAQADAVWDEAFPETGGK